MRTPLLLTVRLWGEISQGAVGSNCIVIDSPGLNDLLRIGETDKPMLVQALIPEFAVKTFDMAVVRWFSRSNKIQRDSARIGPGVQCMADELWAVVHPNLLRLAQHRGLISERQEPSRWPESLLTSDEVCTNTSNSTLVAIRYYRFVAILFVYGARGTVVEHRPQKEDTGTQTQSKQ